MFYLILYDYHNSFPNELKNFLGPNILSLCRMKSTTNKLKSAPQKYIFACFFFNGVIVIPIDLKFILFLFLFPFHFPLTHWSIKETYLTLLTNRRRVFPQLRPLCNNTLKKHQINKDLSGIFKDLGEIRRITVPDKRRVVKSRCYGEDTAFLFLKNTRTK